MLYVLSMVGWTLPLFAETPSMAECERDHSLFCRNNPSNELLWPKPSQFREPRRGVRWRSLGLQRFCRWNKIGRHQFCSGALLWSRGNGRFEPDSINNLDFPFQGAHDALPGDLGDQDFY